MVFLLIGLGLPLLIPVLILLIGLWLFLTGNGIFKFPVFSISSNRAGYERRYEFGIRLHFFLFPVPYEIRSFDAVLIWWEGYY